MFNNDIEKVGALMLVTLVTAAVVTVCAVVEGILSSVGLTRVINKFELIEALQRCPSDNDLPLIRPIKWLKQSNEGRSPCDTPYPDIKLQEFPEDFVLVSSKKGIW